MVVPPIHYLLVVEYLSASVIAGVDTLRKSAAFPTLEVVLFTHDPDRYEQIVDAATVPLQIVACNFRNRGELAALIEPYKRGIRGVICRGDKQIQFLRKIVPVLPAQVPAATAASLKAATNKQLMRSAFLRDYPEITPQFVEVHDSSDNAVEHVESKLRYPVIVKPADLASSLLIQSCHDRVQLEQALRSIFGSIAATYKREDRKAKPQVIVEEYLDGDFYSIDAYVLGAEQIFCCPPVGYIPAKQIGIDDFSLYKRSTPTTLNKQETADAESVVRKAITAVGLTHTTVHAELVMTRHGWKVIELGPRLGRFRNKMYALSYGIDHSMNDIRLHLGLKPRMLQAFKKYSAAYSIYPKQEGVLRAVHGLDLLLKRPEIVWLREYAEPGSKCLFAKNGGHALVEFVIATTDKARFLAVCRLADQVHVAIE